MTNAAASRLAATGGALILVAALLFGLTIGQDPDTVRPGHTADMACGQDGDVHVSAAQYNGGAYSVNGGATTPFAAGFALTLDGAQAWTVVVTAADWPTWTGHAGPCRQPTTTTERTIPPTAQFTAPPPPPPTTTKETATTAPPTTVPTATSSTTSTSSTSTTTTTTTRPGVTAILGPAIVDVPPAATAPPSSARPTSTTTATTQPHVAPRPPALPVTR